MANLGFDSGIVVKLLLNYMMCGTILINNRGIDYRYCVSYYRGRDKKKVKKNGEEYEVESEIDMIIEENGILYPIEIKQSTSATADATSAFMVLDKLDDKKRGCGAVVCSCPQPGQLRENVLVIPVWYI